MVRSGASQTLKFALLRTLKCVGTNGDKQEVVNWKVSFIMHQLIQFLM